MEDTHITVRECNKHMNKQKSCLVKKVSDGDDKVHKRIDNLMLSQLAQAVLIIATLLSVWLRRV